MPEPMNIDLEELQEILRMIPEPPNAGEKRQNALTHDDIVVIAKIVQSMSHKSCAMGFQPEEIARVKTILSIMNKSILGIGWLVVATITAAILKAAWWGIAHGVIETADVAKKGLGK